MGHVMCVLQLIPMLAATYYHYVSRSKTNVVVNALLIVAAAYFGFSELPDIKCPEWTSALILMTGVIFFVGKADAIYEKEPHTKAIMSRRGELQLGACMLGLGVGIFAATVSGGAQDMCILYLPGIIACTVHHYIGGGTKNVVVNVVLMMPAAYFGFVR